MYWHANNLYDWTISQYIPYDKFEWYAANHVTEEWVISVPNEKMVIFF